MKLSIQHQDKYSRGELMLRSFFGIFYIYIPHLLLLVPLGLIAVAVSWIAAVIFMISSSYPRWAFEFHLNLLRWNARFDARFMNLCDGYPNYGFKANDPYTAFELSYPTELSKSKALFKLLFGLVYCLLPHLVAWSFRVLYTCVLTSLAFFGVMFNRKYPPKWHKFNVGTLRWIYRVQVYLSFLSDEYPPFSGDER